MLRNATFSWRRTGRLRLEWFAIQEGFKPGMKEWGGDGWWEWWVNGTNESATCRMGESELERLVRGWRREAGSWLQIRGEAYCTERSVIRTEDDAGSSFCQLINAVKINCKKAQSQSNCQATEIQRMWSISASRYLQLHWTTNHRSLPASCDKCKQYKKNTIKEINNRKNVSKLKHRSDLHSYSKITDVTYEDDERMRNCARQHITWGWSRYTGITVSGLLTEPRR